MAESPDLRPGQILVGQDSARAQAGRRIRLVRRSRRHGSSGWVIGRAATTDDERAWISDWQLRHFRLADDA